MKYVNTTTVAKSNSTTFRTLVVPAPSQDKRGGQH